MDQKTDEEIALMVQKGNKESFSVLVERYEQKMLRYASKFLFYNPDSVEDVVQEIFIRAYMNIQGFDTKRKFSPWLYRIAHNQFINTLRNKGREPISFFDPDTILPHPTTKEQADKEVNSKQLRQMLDHCLNKLDPKYREPLVLYYLEGLDYKDIADVMHIPISTVGVRLKRGKEIMKKIYKRHLFHRPLNNSQGCIAFDIFNILTFIPSNFVF